MGKLNKKAPEGMERYRGQGETSARDLTPNPKELVLESAAGDIERTNRGMNPTAKNEYNRRMQQEAGGRGLLRNAGRAGAVSLATQTGLAIGDEIEKRTGAGKKFVDKSGLGDAVERAVKRSHEGVKLTPEARERVMSGETEGMKKGGKVSASRRADGIAQRGRTRGKMY
jgi:hypothetical protein